MENHKSVEVMKQFSSLLGLKHQYRNVSLGVIKEPEDVPEVFRQFSKTGRFGQID